MILKYQKNILSAFLALTLIASFNVGFYPSTTRAQQVLGTGASTVTIIGVTDIGTVAANKANVTTAVSQKASFGQTLLEWSKKILGIVLKRAILDRIVDQTVAWIQNDFKGQPPFLENPEAFKKSVVDNAVGAAIQSIAPGLCSPFSLQLQIGVVGPAKLSQEFSCTLNQVVNNINNFEDEFKQSGRGRWIKYAAIWEPQNNIWGATIMAESLKEKTIAQAAQAQDLSQTINLGFTATETCTPEFIVKTVPCQEGTPNCVGKYVTNPPTFTKEVATKCTQGTPGCACKIKTPGNFIASEVFGIASSGTEKNAILSADDVAIYIGTLLDAIISHYTQLGARGLMGVLYPEPGDKKTEWDVAVRKAFSSLDAMTYNNTKTMYIDEIDSVLTVKNASLTEVNALIDQENDLLNKLAIIGTCTLPQASEDERKKLADAKPYVATIIAGVESALNKYLYVLKDSLENSIGDMNSVKIEMQNSQYPASPSDPSGQAEQYATISLLSGYQDLKDRKILDIDAANKESESIVRNGDTIRLNVSKALSNYGSLADSCIAASQQNQNNPTP